MLLTFNPAKSNLLVEEFENKKQWQDFVERYSVTGQPKPVNENPTQFPCLMIYDGDLLPTTEEPKFSNFFIYYYANA